VIHNTNKADQRSPALRRRRWDVSRNFIRARCNIYISRLRYDVNVRLSVRLSVTEMYWRIIANPTLPRIAAAVLIAGAVLLAVLLACGSSRAMLASARLSCCSLGR